jgi:phosphatidylglycerophosphate synthase
MSSPALQVVIDARPRGPRGPIATELVLGRPVLTHLLDQALALDSTGLPIAVHARADEHHLLQNLVSDCVPGRVRLLSGPPQAEAAILRTDRFYDDRRLRRAVRAGRDVESAVIWRLNRNPSLRAAEEELTRRRTYQPLGRFWAFAIAEKLAESLRLSRVRPNHLTLIAAALMLSASGLVAFGGPGVIPQITIALGLALALVLDTADGRLARLQRTSSPFGRWLDHVLDELCDVTLHAAVSWSAFMSTERPVWLLTGLFYAAGKYMFLVQSTAGDTLEAELSRGSGELLTMEPHHGRKPRFLPAMKAFIGAVGHADLRWHLWIILGLVGRLDLALLIYAAYFPLRALAGALGRVVARA